MLLAYCGDAQGSERIETQSRVCLQEDSVPGPWGSAGTREFGEAVIRRLRQINGSDDLWYPRISVFG